MTAPTLPEALARLAVLVPGRITRLENWPESWWAVWHEDPNDPEETGFLSLDSDRDPNPLRLEGALREEVEARGWHWTLETMRDGRVAANVIPDWDRRATWGHGRAAPPALALALALIAALEAPHE